MERATERRAQQLADTALRDYHSTAHGYLTFLAQVGENFPDPPKVVRSDELALEVYWRAPNLSKQRIVGRRDTLALPTNIAYHQDHLGIVQNNFPSIIRIGEGDEVRDVPHPLSDAGCRRLRLRDQRFAEHPASRSRRSGVRAPRSAEGSRRSRGSSVRSTSTARPPTSCAWRSPSRARRISTRSSRTSRSCSRTRSCRGGSGCRCIRRSRFGARARWLDFPARGIIRGRWEISRLRDQPGLAARRVFSVARDRERARARARAARVARTHSRFAARPTCAPRAMRTCERCRRRRARSCSSRHSRVRRARRCRRARCRTSRA